MNKFVFHSVGQGLFYSGHINNFSYNFVYDCGSTSNIKFLNYAINNLRTIKDIDFVVISHLHKDHINGLSKLISDYNVKQIYLPYLGRRNMSLVKLLIAFATTSSDENLDTKSNDYRVVSSLYNDNDISDFSPEVIFVGEEAEPVKSNNFLYSEKSLYYSNISSTPIWEFVMFNKRQDTKTLDSLNDKINLLLTSKGYKDIDELIQNNLLDEITEIYMKAFKRGKVDLLNLTSTILIHRPIEPLRLRTVHTNCIYFNNRYFNNFKPVSILTGDAKFDSHMLDKLKKELTKELLVTTIFQVPHHGSKSNWNSLTSSYKFIYNFYVIPFGLGNTYNHPDQHVINELGTLAIKNISYVTQLNEFVYEIY